MHVIRFLVWLTIHKPHQYNSTQLAEIMETIETRVEQMHEIDTMLFAEVTLPQPKSSSLNLPQYPSGELKSTAMQKLGKALTTPSEKVIKKPQKLQIQL